MDWIATVSIGDRGIILLSPRLGDRDKTATLTLPPARDCFRWPRKAPAGVTPPRQFEPTTPSSACKYKLPSLDFSSNQAAQAGQYWPGATASTTAGSIPPSNTLPTPPTADTDVFKPPGHGREGQYHSPTGGVQHSGMSSNLEPSGAGSSLTARRSATSNLPNFELPPPPQLAQKYASFTNINTASAINNQHAPATISVGNLLTPPTNIPGDSLSPITSGVNSVSPAAAQGLPPYTPTSYWPPQTATGTSPYTFGTGTGTSPQAWQPSVNPLFPGVPRGLFSPSIPAMVRNSTGSPAASEGLPPPPYDLNHLPPFPASMSTPANLPAIANQQALTQNYMNAQNSVPTSAAQPSPVSAPDSYIQRPPPTPYYNGSQPSSTPQQTHFPTFQNASPVPQSPISLSAQGSRMTSNGGQPPGMQSTALQQGHHYARPYPSYSLPTISGTGIQGPVMSNVHSPGGQMAMIGTMANHGLPGGMMPAVFNSGHSAQLQQMYGGQQQTPHNERPFKCDQCPQSFNRNHDLKRHKRIHLAVKPFPCGHCEKSFSRKDALKVSWRPRALPVDITD